MARVTVEDCVEKVPNRFELVMLAAQRARDLAAGSPETVERDNDKSPVIALREIAEETIDRDNLRELLVQGMQRHLTYDDPEDEDEAMAVLGQDLTVGTQDLVAMTGATPEDEAATGEPDGSEDAEAAKSADVEQAGPEGAETEPRPEGE